MKRQLLVGLSLVVTLCACGSGNTQRAQGTPGSGVAHQNQGTANHPNGPVGGQQDVQVVSSGFSSLPGDQYGRKPEVTYAAVFRNPNPTTWFAQAAVRFSFRDASGTEIKSQPDTLNVLPGQMAALGGSVEAADVTRLEVQAVVSSWQQLPGGAGAFTVDGVKTNQADDEIKTTGTIHSTFVKDLRHMRLATVYYHGDRIIGGCFGWVSLVPANGTTNFECNAYSLGPLTPSPSQTEVYVEVSHLVLTN